MVKHSAASLGNNNPSTNNSSPGINRKYKFYDHNFYLLTAPAPSPHTSFPTQNPLGPFGALGNPAGDLNSMQQQLMANPNMMQSLMNSPIMDQLMNNPEILSNMMLNNPQMQSLIQSNPQLRQVLTDPSVTLIN